MIAEGQTSILVVELRKKYPCWTLQRIATDVGVTRERVRQILKKHNLPTKAQSPKLFCRYCGIEITCRNGFRASHLSSNKTDLCSKCHKEYELYTMLECEECRGLFFRRTALVIFEFSRRNYNHVWCSKSCQGKWAGRNYGTGINGAAQNRKLTNDQIRERYSGFISEYEAERKTNSWNYAAELSKKFSLNRSTGSQRIHMLRQRGIIV